MFAISVIGSLARVGTLSMTVMAVAFQSITPSALDRLTDNMKIPPMSKSMRFINTSRETMIEMANWILGTNVEKDWKRDYRRFGVFCTWRRAKSAGVSPIWSREMTWEEKEGALLVEILQRGFSA
jgi:hypothetical protein